MLRRLLIKNLVLVESSEINFQPGFNVLTGETGAGKSIILSSLQLLRASRQDTSLIRQGASSSLVEATFDAKCVAGALVEAGISFDDEVVIRRELSQSGKSRIFVNDQAVQLAFLKKISSSLIEISSQHAHLELLEDEAPLLLLDTFAELQETLLAFQNAYKKTVDLKKELLDFTKREQERSRQIETCRREIEEIEKVQPEEGEDETLFKEYAELAVVSENAAQIAHILALLDNEEGSALARLSQSKHLIDKLSQKNERFKELQTTFANALSDIQEVTYELSRAQELAQSSQDRFACLEERLKSLHDLKKKYGPSLSDVLDWKEKQKARLTSLEKETLSIDELQEMLERAQKEADQKAKSLTDARTKAARILSQKVTKELHSLNMPNALFEVALEPQSRCQHGDEAAVLYLTPNRGEPRVKVQDAASGGELARVSLAIKCVMCDKNPVGCILFDEIDANIGGETASIVGKKLAALGKSCQVIAITHFPQVAQSADCHFQIAKKEHQGRTTSHIRALNDPSLKQAEITRMLGGKATLCTIDN